MSFVIHRDQKTVSLELHYRPLVTPQETWVTRLVHPLEDKKKKRPHIPLDWRGGIGWLDELESHSIQLAQNLSSSLARTTKTETEK
jgi:hypothetical protein